MNIFEASKKSLDAMLERGGLVRQDNEKQKKLDNIYYQFFLNGYHSPYDSPIAEPIADEIMQLMDTAKFIVMMSIPHNISMLMSPILKAVVDPDTSVFLRIITNAYKDGIAFRLSSKAPSLN